MKVEIIDKTKKRHGEGGLTKEDTKLLRHYVGEATDRLYNDLLKKKKPGLVQVEVCDGDGGHSYLTSDESHNCFRIGKALIRSSPSGKFLNPKLVIAHELVHGVDNIMMDGEYKMMYPPNVTSGITHLMVLIYRCRSEGLAVLGEHLMYDEFYPDKESPDYNPYEEIQYRDYYSGAINPASKILDSFVDFLERALEKSHWAYVTDQKIEEDVIVYRCDVVLVEVMRALGLISDDVARSYGIGYYLESLMKEDRSHIMQTALSMTLSQFIEGILVAFRGKSSLVDRFLSYCVRFQNRIEKDEITLFTLLAKTRVVNVEEHNRVLEKIVKTQMPDERLEQMVKALDDTPKEQTTPLYTGKEVLDSLMHPKNVPYQMNPGALKMIDQLYEYYLQYKDDPFYKDYAQAANWSLNYYFKRDDLIDDDLAFIGRTDDLILLNVMQQMIKREMAPDLKFRLNDSSDGLIVFLDDNRGDVYIPEWHILDGRLYPVVEVRLGNLQKLSSLYIPEAITSIDMKCISVGSSLSSIRVAENHPRYDSRNNCNAIIETATNKLILGCKTTEIPFSVTSIGNYAFRNIPQRKLKYPAEVKLFPRIELLIPDEVIEIAHDAFHCFEGTIYYRDPSMIDAPDAEVKAI